MLLLQYTVILLYFVISLVVNLLLCLIYKVYHRYVCIRKKHSTCRCQHYPSVHASTEDLGKYLLWIRGVTVVWGIFCVVVFTS